MQILYAFKHNESSFPGTLSAQSPISANMLEDWQRHFGVPVNIVVDTFNPVDTGAKDSVPLFTPWLDS